MENQKYSSIAEAISRNTPTLFEPVQSSSVSGGCINQTSKLEGVDGRNFFVKQNDLDFLPFFQSEAIALQEIKETATIKVPEVIAHGTVDGNSFLVLEFIQEGPPSKAGQTQLGRQLAELHKIEQPFLVGEKTIVLEPRLNQTRCQKTGLSSIRHIAYNTNFNWQKEKGDASKKSTNCWMESTFSSRNTPRNPRSSMAIYGVEMPLSTSMGSPLFSTLQATTEIGKPTWHLPTCLEVFPDNSMMATSPFIQSTMDFHKGKFFIIFIMNLIILICLAVDTPIQRNPAFIP